MHEDNIEKIKNLLRELQKLKSSDRGNYIIFNPKFIEEMENKINESKKEMNLEKIRNFLNVELGFCGCGDPEEDLKFLKKVLILFRDVNNDDKPEITHNTILELFNNNEAIYRSYCYWLDRAYIIEHGGSIGFSWLNYDKGYEVLDAIEKYEDKIFEDRYNEGDEIVEKLEKYVCSVKENKKKLRKERKRNKQ